MYRLEAMPADRACGKCHVDHAGVDPRHDLPSWKRKAAITRRTEELIEEQRDRPKRLKEMEKEAREEGLAQPIDKSNKGFAMLKKMGFKEGAGAWQTVCI
jgi:hypothetical protein